MTFLLVLFALLTAPVYDGGAIHLRLIDNTEVHGTLIERDSQGYLVELDDGGLHHVSFAAVKGTSRTTNRTVTKSTSNHKNSPKPLKTFDVWLPKHTTSPTLPELNQKLVEFCQLNEGKVVAHGYCAELAVEAFKFAGVKTNWYGWGRRLSEGEPLLPGDVLQYVDVTLLRDGAEFSSIVYPLHTSIVAEVTQDYVVVFEQNSTPSKRVVKFKIYKDELWSDLPWAFRPVKSLAVRKRAWSSISTKVHSSGILERPDMRPSENKSSNLTDLKWEDFEKSETLKVD